MTEPGLDLHEWESQWAQLQEDAADSPEEALPEIVRLVGEMLADRGFDLENPVVVEDESRDIVADFLAAREIARAAETTKLEQEDIQTALEDLTEIHDYLVEDRRRRRGALDRSFLARGRSRLDRSPPRGARPSADR
jgi:hypothetical protein